MLLGSNVNGGATVKYGKNLKRVPAGDLSLWGGGGANDPPDYMDAPPLPLTHSNRILALSSQTHLPCNASYRTMRYVFILTIIKS